MDFTFAPAPFEIKPFPGAEDSNIWGNPAIAPDGKVYVPVSIRAGNRFLSNAVYCYDPVADTMTKVLDWAKDFGPEIEPGYCKQNENHCQLVVGSDGKIYGGTTGVGPWDDEPYEGGHLFRYDPKTGETEDLGAPVPGIGIHGLWLDERRGMAWGLLIHGKASPPRRVFGYNIVHRRTEFILRAPVPEDCFLDARGRFYSQFRPGYLFRYDPDLHEIRELRSIPLPQDPLISDGPNGPRGTLAKLTCSGAILHKDGRIFHTTMGGQLIILHPDAGTEGQIELLGPTIGDGTYFVPQLNLALTPDGSALYYLTGRADAYDPRLGPTGQLVRYDLMTGRRTHLGWLETDPPTDWRHFGAGVAADGTVYFAIHPPGKLAIYRP